MLILLDIFCCSVNDITTSYVKKNYNKEFKNIPVTCFSYIFTTIVTCINKCSDIKPTSFIYHLATVGNFPKISHNRKYSYILKLMARCQVLDSLWN